MEVKGHQRSNVVNYVLGLQYLSRELLMQAKNDDDLHGGQRSTGQINKQCSMAIKLGQKNR